MTIEKSVLRLVQKQARNHSLGKLVFLTSIGPRAWGFSPDNIGCDYQGLYLSKEDNTYYIVISGTSIDKVGSISLISFERIVRDILNSDISALILVNGPAIYASKEFLEFRKRVNLNLSKQVYQTCSIKQIHAGRRDYLYDFFFLGNGIAISERKKVITNLSELNKKVLKIPAIDKVIEEEKTGLPFENRQICKEIQKKLKVRLEKAEKKSRLPKTVDVNRFNKLNIIKKINLYFWYWPDGNPTSSRLKNKKIIKHMKKRKIKKPVRRPASQRGERGKEKSCKHQWAPLLAKYKGQVISTTTKLCLKCGEMKIGQRTVKISRHRLSIEGGTKLKIPVGTNLYA